MASAAATDWIEWTGGNCPLANPTSHQVRYRDGVQSPVRGKNSNSFADAVWQHSDTLPAFDIVAYRVVQS